MGRQRTVRLVRGERIEVVFVLGTQLNIEISGTAPSEAEWFSMRHSANIGAKINKADVAKPKVVNGEKLWPLERDTVIEVRMDSPSTETNEEKVSVVYYGPGTDAPIDKAGVYLTAIEVSLDVDADRDGVVEKNNPHKASWTWGSDGNGAILLVNCDKDSILSRLVDGGDENVYSKEDLQDMSMMLLRIRGPEKLPTSYNLLLHISPSDSDKLGVFHSQNKQYTYVMGKKKLHYKIRYTGTSEHEFFVEGLCFPDKGFSGLLTINVSLLESMPEEIPETPIFTDTVVFRVTPLIITPYTLEPIEVYVCSVKDNYLFLKQIKSLVSEANYKITICFEYVNREDRWMQDEMEFGYIEAPHKGFPVVLDSPKVGEIKDFPVRELLGPDFGYVTKVALSSEVTTLDSFGNLEVSPPVTVNGKEYPLGRIIIGSSFPTSTRRRMTKVVRDFIHAQEVQAPFELYTDWLLVGHVDEFLTFIPAPDRKGFRLLLASPIACYKVLQKQKSLGHGDVTMFQGGYQGDARTRNISYDDDSEELNQIMANLVAVIDQIGKLKSNKSPEPDGLEVKWLTINKVLSTDSLQQENNYVQHCIDWNRDILKEQLGLTEDDIIDIPALFRLDKSGKALAFFPSMVNMVVLGTDLGIPKPYGPIIEETCCLEGYMTSMLKPLGLKCTFIDDVVSYHRKLGEVHCGTNVRRKPFTYKWWNMVP